jgi:TorA maturation chaperone TorD
LAGWGTDYVKLSFDKSKIIKDLSNAEFTELFVQQMKKESPGYVSQLVEDKILIIK